MEEVTNIKTIIKETKYKNHLSKILPQYKNILTEKEYNYFLDENKKAVEDLNSEMKSLAKDLKKGLKNHKDESERNKFYLTKYHEIALDFTKKFEEHYTNHIDFLFHKLMDLVKKRKYYFKSEKLDDGLYVANED